MAQVRIIATSTANARATAQARATVTAAAASAGASATAKAASAATTEALVTTMAIARTTSTAEAQVTATAKARAIAEDKAAATARAKTTATARARATATARAPAPATTAPQTQNILFQDNFSSNVNNWWAGSSDEYADSEHKVTNGKYRMSMTSNRSVWSRATVPNVSARDFLLTIDATVVEMSGDFSSGHPAIVFSFRREDNDNYNIQIDNDAYVFSVTTGGTNTTLQEWTSHDAIDLNTGVTNSFAILAEGSNFTIFANGRELTSIYDTTLSKAGQLRLGISLFGANQTLAVDFDNLIIKKVP